MPDKIWILDQVKKIQRFSIRSVDHSAVLAHLDEEGGMSVRYGVMTALSCGIAMLGLLLSSPAVVIGAMLISPLMDPILLFGFSLTVLDQRTAVRSLKAIIVGVCLAVTLAALIVWLSPLNAATPEILSRTRPNFFDLLVAIFSALAGSYAVTHQKGETLVGAAIATALMPPLAVTGYGIAIQNWAIFSGAAGLFLTNLLAIALTASVVAKFFGFGTHNSPQHTFWQTVSIFVVFALLSIPLGFSLQQIANETLLTARARSTLHEYFRQDADHIYEFSLSFPKDAPIQVHALVLTNTIKPNTDSELQKLLERRLGRPIELVLSLVRMDTKRPLDQQAVEQLLAKSVTATEQELRERTPATGSIIASEMGVSILDTAVNFSTKEAVVRTKAPDVARLEKLRAGQVRLQKQLKDWRVKVLVGLNAFPPVEFDAGKTDLNENTAVAISAILWAYQQAGARAVNIVGWANLLGRGKAANSRIALQRANAVAAPFQKAGIVVTTSVLYPSTSQRDAELKSGRKWYREVQIGPVTHDHP